MEVRWDLAFKGSAPQAVDLKQTAGSGGDVPPTQYPLSNHPEDSDPEYFPLLTLRYGFKHLWCNTFKGHNHASELEEQIAIDLKEMLFFSGDKTLGMS